MIEYKNDLLFWNSSFHNFSGYVAREQDRWKISLIFLHASSPFHARSLSISFCLQFFTESTNKRIICTIGYKIDLHFWIITCFLTRSIKDIADLPFTLACSPFCFVLLQFFIESNKGSSLYSSRIPDCNSSSDNPTGYVARGRDRWKISPRSSLLSR